LNKITLALIIAKPSHLRNGLQSLLRTFPQIEILAESHDPSILMKMHQELQPDLIVVDAAEIDAANWSAITKIKTDWPNTKVIVLTENEHQGQTAREAGADYYLLKGFPATELAQLIETSLIDGSRVEDNLLTNDTKRTEK
jgi:two-component system, NarL family, nitrate/nitrite response regulator NarL